MYLKDLGLLRSENSFSKPDFSEYFSVNKLLSSSKIKFIVLFMRTSNFFDIAIPISLTGVFFEVVLK